MNQKEWAKLEKDFKKEGWRDWVDEVVTGCVTGSPGGRLQTEVWVSKEEMEDLRRPNKWDTPLSMLNPNMLEMLINLNKRVSELEYQIQKLERQ